jgi:predicted Co/Zn/Cd cation transporter (cation efflux family)
MSDQNSKERKALKISIAGALFMALLGFGFSILTDSEAVFLDGVFSLVNMTMGLITLKVAQIIFEKSTKRFHYGKAQVEPLLNTAKGLLFIGVIVMAGYAALQSILTGGRPMVFSWAILYSFIAAVGCFGIGYYVESQNKENPTPILAVEAKSWLIDGALSSVVLLAFVSGYFLSKTAYAEFTVYIDPGLVIIMSLFVLPVPYKILKDNLLDLLLGAPDVNLQRGVRQIANGIIKEAPVEDFDFRFVKTGRFILCDILVLISKKEKYSISDFDPIRKKLMSEIVKKYPEVDLVIEITTDKEMYLKGVAM